MKLRAALLIGLTAATLGFAQSPTAESGAERAERVLAAMGGRDAWARVASYVIRATHYESARRLPYANTIYADYAAPRVRIEARNVEFDIQRGLDRDDGWRHRNGQTVPFTREQVRNEQRWWEANVYRTLHRLAARGPELQVRAIGENRLEVWRADGTRLNWFELNAAAEPILFGTWDSDTGTIFGPLVQHGPVKCPKWGANHTGTWRYEVVELLVSEQSSKASFSAP